MSAGTERTSRPLDRGMGIGVAGGKFREQCTQLFLTLALTTHFPTARRLLGEFGTGRAIFTVLFLTKVSHIPSYLLAPNSKAGA